MNIQIDAKIVEDAVAKAIVDSAIGEKIKKSVEDLLKQSWDNPIDTAIKRVVTDVALKIVQVEYHNKIAETIKAKVTDETIDEFVKAFWDTVWKR